ncbi:DUF3649 domain-containing protein [Pseudomonas typographi]|uniref:DUF3649 domain-containing protein n=1 Tax=Pseudomonas typographi TaxID=2715964 RepID=A0ABR7YYK9_9PSED|nr:DUF3649 domain-containing protein [Pseudomonas typographi]MBD1550828.1 DUF3649 domain-containing protein [Pseudomonas typographi]MBD1587770.1 DUF3649 domain-containing protein [Pseudomonas typographi]MBD1598293.1 DUF3649 domain-containing protein [Pseudomonas typographi]
MKTKTSGVPLAYRLAVTSRVVAAALGGYAVAALASVCLAWVLPMAQAQGVITSMMLGFVVYLAAALWCFACRSAWRAWAAMLGCALVLGVLDAGLYWAHLR